MSHVLHLLTGQGPRSWRSQPTKPGLKLHTRNYRRPQGELDLVLLDGGDPVQEARYRQDGSYGTVGPDECCKLTLATQHLLKTHGDFRRKALRFHVVRSGEKAKPSR